MSCNIYYYAVLAIVSNSYPPLPGRLPTRYSPVRNSSREAGSSFSVLLACIRHAASVRPEPGSNSHIKFELSLISVTDRFIFLLFDGLSLNSRLHIGSSCSVFKGLCHSFSQATTILVYHSYLPLSTDFLNFFQVFLTAIHHSPYGIRTRVTAVKRRCLNPLTNGP